MFPISSFVSNIRVQVRLKFRKERSNRFSSTFLREKRSREKIARKLGAPFEDDDRVKIFTSLFVIDEGGRDSVAVAKASLREKNTRSRLVVDVPDS